jgi:hypothetical protein
MRLGIENAIFWQSGLHFPCGLLVYHKAHEYESL